MINILPNILGAIVFIVSAYKIGPMILDKVFFADDIDILSDSKKIPNFWKSIIFFAICYTVFLYLFLEVMLMKL